MMRSYQAGVCFRLAVAFVIHRRRKRTSCARPVVVRYEVEVGVEGALGLFLNNAEDLVNGSHPCDIPSVLVVRHPSATGRTVVIDNTRIVSVLIVRPRKFDESTKGVDFVLENISSKATESH